LRAKKTTRHSPAGTLPEDHVFMITGGHNWVSWEQLWKQMLGEHILCADY